METTLKEIISISGHSGLFKFVSQGRQGIIVESLIDGKRINVPVTAKVSAISDIAVFTDSGEVALREVLAKIKEMEDGKSAIDPKSDPKEIVKYFAKAMPDYDRDRVYTSDIKKIITWYNQLQAHNLLDLLKEEEPSDNAEIK
ncbi:hypothetical protein CYCD_27340 [Tenuifilaceae bacterium CYCD]|nr:hypothetical protein CYCD_27340 [Tenuifilaceae bacterium CYCD]